jgi:putative transcriptional regulator
VAATRLKAGLTQQEFARVTGASLGTVRKWEHGERSPSGAARMLVRILARDPALVIAEAGLAEGTRRRRGGEAGLAEGTRKRREGAAASRERSH